MWPIIIALGLLQILIIVAFVFFFRRMRRTMEKRMTKPAMRQGRNNALVCSVGILLVMLVLTSALMWGLDWSFWVSIIATSGVLWFVTYIFFLGSWLRSKSKASSVLLDCGEHPTKGLFLFNAALWSFFAVLCIGGAVFAAVTGEEKLLALIAASLFTASFASYWFIMATGRLWILENGIWQYFGLLKWDRIESYDWQGEENRTLMLKVKTKFSLLGKGALPVPLEHRDAVNELLQKYATCSR